MQEDIYQQCEQQGINLQNIQIGLAVQYKKKKKLTQSKMGRIPKQTFLQRRYTDGQEAHEKMLNITNN